MPDLNEDTADDIDNGPVAAPALYLHSVFMGDWNDYHEMRTEVVNGMTCATLTYLRNIGMPEKMLLERSRSMQNLMAIWFDANSRIASPAEREAVEPSSDPATLNS